MSIANEIIRLQLAKESISRSIENKGISIPDGTRLNEFADFIDNISIGGHGGVVGQIHLFKDTAVPPPGFILADGRQFSYGDFPALDLAWQIPTTVYLPDANAIATMTGPTSANQTASASSEFNPTTFAAWKAFQNSIPTFRYGHMGYGKQLAPFLD